MTALSLAIIGKNDELLYLREFSDSWNEEETEEELFGLPPLQDGRTKPVYQCSLRHQFLLHAALDRFEQLAGPPPGIAWRKSSDTGHDAMFAGLLCPAEEMRIYGYMTTTKIKLLLSFVDDQPDHHHDEREPEIKDLFIKIHGLFVEYIMNPFCSLDGPIKSDRFDEVLADYVKSFNKENPALAL